ncbi:MAG: exo-alpha-sialidase, partial [Planctomycetaceae bacterium]|nr:exo-alpha-sialidase [Planctomycetaceae bacterium]
MIPQVSLPTKLAMFYALICSIQSHGLSVADPPKAAPKAPGFTIPYIDLDAQSHRQTVIDREEGQYLGHPTTVLLEDNKTILCVY